MNIIIAGGTGLIGTALANLLVEHGHIVKILSRSNQDHFKNRRVETIRWDGKTINNWGHFIEETDAVVNLAGASIGGGLWTSKRRKLIVDSRLDAGRALVEGISKSARKPQVLLQASGVDYYPSDLKRVFTPADPQGKGFMPETAVLWEKSTQAVEEAGVRRVVMRISQVMTSKGGSLELIRLPFKLFVGGPLGSGEQWWTWIHIDDAVSAMEFIIENSQISGTVHITSPTPVKNKDFGRVLAKVLNRPCWIPVPEFALKFILGEMSSLVLGGRKIYPDDLKQGGFKFKYPELEMALNSLLK